MKNSLLIVILALLIIIFAACGIVINWQAEKNEIKKQNMEYEQYLNKEITGTELATIISRAVNENEKNNVLKDEKGYYLDNNDNSIKIDLKMLTINKTYPMEEIYNNQISEFVRNFNVINFKCTNIEYHSKTGKISKLVFEELQ